MSMMTGLYRFELLSSAQHQAFEQHMQGVVFKDAKILQLTRVTSGFTHQLLQGPTRQYAWHVVVTLVQGSYDFEQNADRIREAVKDLATLTGVESYKNVGAPHDFGSP